MATSRPALEATPLPATTIYVSGEYCGYYCAYVTLYLLAITPATGSVVPVEDNLGYSYLFNFTSVATGSRRLFATRNYGVVTEWELGNTTPIAMFADPGFLVAASSTDQLYVAHGAGINVYPPGATKPRRTLTDGLYNVTALAVGPGDGLYVSNGTDVVVYAGRGSKPVRTIHAGIDSAVLLAFDGDGQLLVYNKLSGTIAVYPRQAVFPSTIIRGVTGGTWMTIGPTNTLYVLHNFGHAVSEYDHEGTTLSRTIKVIAAPAAAVVDSHDTLFVLNDGPIARVWSFPSGKTKPSTRFQLPYSLHQDAWAVGLPW